MYKKNLLLLIMFLNPIFGMKPGGSMPLLVPKPAFTKLLNYFDTPPDLDALIQTSQKWRSNSTSYDHAISKPLLYPYFEQLELINAIQPTQQQYAYILVPGDCYQQTTIVLEHLWYILNSKINCQQIILLTSDRSLDENEQMHFQQQYKTEIQMINYLYSLLMKNSKQIANIPNLLVQANCVYNKNQVLLPAIDKKITTWLDQAQPSPGTCLLVAQQPYATLFKKAITTTLTDRFNVDIAAPRIQDCVSAHTLLNVVGNHILLNLTYGSNSNDSFFQTNL